MASAKQIKARKLFAKRVKRGDFRKAISKTKKSEHPQRMNHYSKGSRSKRLWYMITPSSDSSRYVGCNYSNQK